MSSDGDLDDERKCADDGAGESIGGESEADDGRA